MKFFRIIFKDRSLWYKLIFPSVLPVILVIIIIIVMLMGSFERVMQREEELRIKAFLMKPFVLSDLSKTIRKVLDKK